MTLSELLGCLSDDERAHLADRLTTARLRLQLATKLLDPACVDRVDVEQARSHCAHALAAVELICDEFP